jgi:signal transduction histidine kinase
VELPSLKRVIALSSPISAASVPPAREAAEWIVSDSTDAAGVIHRIRALFKQAPLDSSIVELNALISQTLQLKSGELTNHNITVRVDLDTGTPRVHADRIQLQHVILNLLTNAIEASQARDASDRRIFVSTRHDDVGNAVVELSNTGIGLQHPDKIFEPFFTTKDHGMGMGLAIFRSIINAHHGRIWATTDDLMVTAFGFLLPSHHES